jgi:hypothetical protein
MSESATACCRAALTAVPYQTSLSDFPFELPAELRDDKFFESLHIFLASKVNIRILHYANSLQVCAG